MTIRKIASAAGLVFFSILVSLLVGELLFRVALNSADFLEITPIDDAVLGFRIAENTNGHDALGFRNSSVPERAAIVAVGDSQTYGQSTYLEGAWPYQLSQLSGKSVYNMAIGAYGPMEYLYLIQNIAPKLHPELIVAGVYLGNDLFDACWSVQKRPRWSAWRNPAAVCPEVPEVNRQLSSFRDWLSKHSVVYGVVKATVLSRLVTWTKQRDAKQGSPDEKLSWQDPADAKVSTIFTAQARESVLDLKNPGVEEGLRITARAVAAMRDEATKQGAKFLVVVIPTKEAVYCRYLQSTDFKFPPKFAQLCQDEPRVKQQLTDGFAAAGIDYVDALGPMQSAAAKHVVMYREDDDGHPVASGYRVIAQTVLDAIKAK